MGTRNCLGFSHFYIFHVKGNGDLPSLHVELRPAGDRAAGAVPGTRRLRHS